MAYETFERKSVRVEGPTLSVGPDGRLFLNAAATRLLENTGVRAVRILWDKAKCGIALLATKKGDKNSYSISFSRGRSASIAPKAFLHYIGWSSTRRRTVAAKWNEQHMMLEAVLPSRFIQAQQSDGAGPSERALA